MAIHDSDAVIDQLMSKADLYLRAFTTPGPADKLKVCSFTGSLYNIQLKAE